MPAGLMQNTCESGVGFVRSQVIMATMGTDGMGYLPYLTALFFFIFFLVESDGGAASRGWARWTWSVAPGARGDVVVHTRL